MRSAFSRLSRCETECGFRNVLILRSHPYPCHILANTWRPPSQLWFEVALAVAQTHADARRRIRSDRSSGWMHGQIGNEDRSLARRVTSQRARVDNPATLATEKHASERASQST